MRLLSELRVPFDHVGSHVALTGAASGFGVAYFLFLLMFLTMIAECCWCLCARSPDLREGPSVRANQALIAW